MQTPTYSLKLARWGCALLTGLALSATAVQAADIAIDIMCSPSVVMLSSAARGDWMTVHADIPYRLVDQDVTVELNGLPARLLKADNCGRLVAKFSLTDLKADLEPGIVTLTMTGATVTGDTFTGSDDVRVMAARRLPPGGPPTNPKGNQAQQRNGTCVAD